MTASDDASQLYSFFPFSTSTLNDILGKFSELSLKNIILGYMFMVRIFYKHLITIYKHLSLFDLISYWYFMLFHTYNFLCFP